MPVRISLIPAGPDATGARIPAERAGTTVTVTPAQIAAAALAGVSAPPAVAAAGSAGVATTPSRSDHTHAHGNQGGGALHADVVAGGASGFMTGAQATKLAGIETGADVTDAANVDAAGAVMEADFTATHTILMRQGGASPVAVAIPLSSFVGRIGSGDIIPMTIAQAKTLLGYAGSEVSFDPTGTALSSTNVQDAIEELDSDLATAILTVDEADEIAFDPTGTGLTATDVQAALAELDARPSGGGLTIEYISGFVADVGTPANRRGYTRGSDPLSATLSFTACVLFQSLASTFLSPAASIFGTFNGIAGGWDIHRIQAGIGFRYYDNGGVVRTASHTQVLLTRKFVIAHLRVVNNGLGNSLTVQLFINGTQAAEVFNATAGGTYAAGSNLCLGPAAEGAVLPAAPVRVTGCGYITSALTADQIAAHAEACFEAADFVDPPAAPLLTDGWRVDDAGANPGTTWTSFKAGASLTALGAPTALPRATKSDPILWG